ncbi:MAG: FAD:protein FMN transferase [Hyphomicrobiaceae bacterium]|nr:FAD:protein FMN transferase [Hyphomicrobiaceae bacterium]
MPDRRISRRTLFLLAAAGAVVLPAAASRAPAVEWNGHALGAQARMVFLGADRLEAEHAISDCLDEIERLERIFSLHREDSELVRLNGDGELLHPSLDLLRLLRQTQHLSRATGGLFDPTIQPLWRLLAGWYADDPEGAPPPPDRLAAAMSSIGMDRVQIGSGRVRLAQRARLTLNGIAQGYITDQVALRLRRRGWTNVLIDIGEVAALGGRADGRPFDIAVRGGPLRISLADAALATSSVNSLMLSARRRLSHLIHPGTAATPAHWQSVTVRNATAAVADGLSTALALASPDEIEAIVGRFPGTRAWATRADGATTVFSS